jgi:hypothetical protein
MKWFIEWINSWFAKKTDPKPKPEPKPDPVPVPTPDPTPTPKPDTVDPVDEKFPTATMHTCPDAVRGWPVVSKLTVRKEGSFLYFHTDKPGLWPNNGGTCGHIQCGLYRNDSWHYGPCDALRPFNRDGDAPCKKASCACVPDGKKQLYIPREGEEVRFVVTGFCRYGNDMKPQQRTTEAVMTW